MLHRVRLPLNIFYDKDVNSAHLMYFSLHRYITMAPNIANFTAIRTVRVLRALRTISVISGQFNKVRCLLPNGEAFWHRDSLTDRPTKKLFCGCGPRLSLECPIIKQNHKIKNWKSKSWTAQPNKEKSKGSKVSDYQVVVAFWFISTKLYSLI